MRVTRGGRDARVITVIERSTAKNARVCSAVRNRRATVRFTTDNRDGPRVTMRRTTTSARMCAYRFRVRARAFARGRVLHGSRCIAANEAHTRFFHASRLYSPAKRSAHRRRGAAGCPPVEHTSRVMCARQVSGARAPSCTRGRCIAAARNAHRSGNATDWRGSLPGCDDRVRRRHGWPPVASLCRFSFLSFSPRERGSTVSPSPFYTHYDGARLRSRTSPRPRRHRVATLLLTCYAAVSRGGGAFSPQVHVYGVFPKCERSGRGASVSSSISEMVP